MARLNINVSEKLLSQLRIIAAVQDKTVTDIVVELITAYVRDKKKDALTAITETLDQQVTDGGKMVEEHLITEHQQVTDTEKQQEETLDSNGPDIDRLRLRTILTNIASRKPQLVFVADDGKQYVRNRQEVREKLEVAGIKAKPSQPKLNGKGQRAYRLDDAPESPTSDENKS